MGVKLSVCEICFLNCMQRVINAYVHQVHALVHMPPPANLSTNHAVTATTESRASWKEKRRKYVRAKLAFMIRRCIANLRSLCEMVRFQLPLQFN